MNTLLRLLRKKGTIAIADAGDLLPLIKGLTRKQLEDLSNEALNIVSKWAEDYDLLISHGKSSILSLRKPR